MSEFFIELKMSVKEGTAKTHVATLNERMEKAWELTGVSMSQSRTIAIEIDDSTVAIGFKIIARAAAQLKFDDAIKGVLNSSGQHLHFNVELGSSIEELINSDEAMIMLLAKGGFKVSHKQCLIGNLNRVIQELQRSDSEVVKQSLNKFMMFSSRSQRTTKKSRSGAPRGQWETRCLTAALMLSLNAEFELNFDDFSDL